MTAHAMAGDEQKSLNAGMDDHVTKPIDPEQLFTTLQKWIKPVAERTAIADKLRSATDAMAPFCGKAAQLAEDFDFDGIQKLLNELDN